MKPPWNCPPPPTPVNPLVSARVCGFVLKEPSKKLFCKAGILCNKPSYLFIPPVFLVCEFRFY